MPCVAGVDGARARRVWPCQGRAQSGLFALASTRRRVCVCVLSEPAVRRRALHRRKTPPWAVSSPDLGTHVFVVLPSRVCAASEDRRRSVCDALVCYSEPVRSVASSVACRRRESPVCLRPPWCISVKPPCVYMILDVPASSPVQQRRRRRSVCEPNVAANVDVVVGSELVSVSSVQVKAGGITYAVYSLYSVVHTFSSAVA